MPTRLLDPNGGRSPSPAPKNPVEWHRLMQQVIAQAQRTGSRHLLGLRQAASSGQNEAMLRRMGILSATDIAREFPEKI